MAQADRTLRVATVQFEPVDGDKRANLSSIKQLVQRAQAAGPRSGAPPLDLVCFHECCITGCVRVCPCVTVLFSPAHSRDASMGVGV
jgi:hypothetical protein